MAFLCSVNLGTATPTDHSDVDVTGIDKLPVTGPVEVRAPGPVGTAGSGVVGDDVCDLRNHGGDDQAVYAYAREDLDAWAAELGYDLRSGSFGENLTTSGIDVTNALIGERWRIGEEVVLEIATTRFPCRTFAGYLDERGWVKRFTQWAVPGAYFRVITPGFVRVNDTVTVIHRPDHEVTVGLTFRAFTLESELLSEVLEADALADDRKAAARKRLGLKNEELRSDATVR